MEDSNDNNNPDPAVTNLVQKILQSFGGRPLSFYVREAAPPQLLCEQSAVDDPEIFSYQQMKTYEVIGLAGPQQPLQQIRIPLHIARFLSPTIYRFCGLTCRHGPINQPIVNTEEDNLVKRCYSFCQNKFCTQATTIYDNFIFTLYTVKTIVKNGVLDSLKKEDGTLFPPAESAFIDAKGC